MELLQSGFHCVAKADVGSNNLKATAYLPYPIDLSKRSAELAVKYVAVTPNWNHLKTLHIELNDLNDDDGIVDVAIQNLVDTRQETVILNVRQHLEKAQKAKKPPLLKIVKSKQNKKTYEFHLRANASVRFSRELSELFGVGENYENRTNESIVFLVIYKAEKMTSSTNIYYLKGEEIASNFMVDSKQDKILEILHLPGTETLGFHPDLSYNALEVSHLQKITFTLFKEDNTPVVTDQPDLYVVCHIRETR